MTRTLPLLLLASALLAGAALAQPAPLPDDERFDQAVSFSTGRQGEDLDTMLSALARSVGLTPVVDQVPEQTIQYDIDEPTPFRQVWNLILSLNDLDYVLQENDVIVIGPTEALTSLRRAEPRTEDAGPPEADDTVQRVYRVNGSPDDLADVVRRLVPAAEVERLPGTSALLVIATEAQQDEVQTTLDEFDEPAVERRRYRVGGPAERATDYVASFVPEAAFEALEGTDVLIVTATAEQHARVEEALGDYEPAAAAAEPSETERRVYRVNGEPAQVREILATLVPEVNTEVLAGASAVVVVGDEDQHARVQEVLDEFDAPRARVDLVQRVYSLSNAQASDLQEILNATDLTVGTAADDAPENGEEAQDAEAEEDGADRNFTVVADERTNSLIITATPAVQARLADLIPELDAPQTQVNVQVRIQEINRRVASNLGINLGAASGNFAANLLDSGLRFVFDPQSAVSGLNIGAVLDTLESQGLSRRVDDSTLTVLNNGTGRMQSGGRIEITFPSSDGEIATRTIEFGVIIEVSPRVADDGRVTLDVTAEVSDVLVPINEGGIPERIDFSEREVTSTVTLRPGQTVLLGGLLQNTFSQTERRVPILGQIPLIGALFGSTEVEEENSELMLVVNAQVID